MSNLHEASVCQFGKCNAEVASARFQAKQCSERVYRRQNANGHRMRRADDEIVSCLVSDWSAGQHQEIEAAPLGTVVMCNSNHQR